MSIQESGQPVTWSAVIATAGVIIGLGDMPYGYYMLLRLGLCGISLFLLVGAQLRLEDWHRWALGASAVLYNPIIPIRIGDKGIWIVINIATVALFWLVRVRRI